MSIFYEIEFAKYILPYPANAKRTTKKRLLKKQQAFFYASFAKRRSFISR